MSDSAVKLVCATPDLRPSALPVLWGLHRAGLLDAVVTTLAMDRESQPLGLLGHAPHFVHPWIARQLKRRVLPPLPGVTVDAHASREIVRLLVDRSLHHEILNDYVWWWSERGFDRYVARTWVERTKFLYGFELASAESFRAHKRLGGVSILGQVIAHHQTAYSILREELERHPEASTPLMERALQTAPRVNGLKDEQYDTSDLIVANSSFVRDSFIAAGVPGTKIVVVPGAGPAVELPDLEGMVCRRTDPGRPALFVAAGHLSIRKGTHYLLEAWRKIGPRPDAQLLLVGHDSLPPALKEGLPDNVTIRANVPREELFGIFREATSLVLPSLCEGFAMVILEALAHALPVITTPNSGGADFVRNGEAGWIVPIRDPESLADRIVWSIEHRDQMAQMGMTGRIRSQYWTWDDFASVHAGIIREFMETQTVSASAWAEPWNDVPSINA